MSNGIGGQWASASCAVTAGGGLVRTAGMEPLTDWDSEL